MHIPNLRSVKRKSGKTNYYFEVPLSKPRKLIPLGDDLPKAMDKMLVLQNPNNQVKKFEDAVHAYFNCKFFKQKSERTQKDYLSYLPSLSFSFKDAPLHLIQPHHLSEFLELNSDTPVQANRKFALFSVIYNYARRIGLTSNPNPCLGISKFKERAKTRLLTDFEFDQFIVSCSVDPIFANEVVLMSQLASRKADTVKLLKSAWNMQAQTLTISIDKTNNKVQIEVGPNLEKTLQYLFVHSTKHTFFQDAYSTFNRKFYKFLHLSGVDKFSPHDLRAFAATKHCEEFGIEQTQILLGHSHLQTTQIYIRNRVGRKVKTK